MKKKIFLLSLVVLCFGFFPILKTAADTVYNTIFTSAEATREVAPDMAILNFSIENTDKNSQNALEANKTASSKVLSALKNISTENDNIRTSDFAMYPNYSSKDRNLNS